ncbi:hypothetical protein ACF0H5_000234 [Mactra antiquata]
MEYPLNVYHSTYKQELSKRIETLADFTYSGNWKDVFEILENDGSLVNRCRLPRNNSAPKLYTPLHQAAHHCAPEEVFVKLISLGASKSLKTAEGKTAYDIAKQKNLPEHILKLIEVPAEITDHAEEIKKMENGLHEVIYGRAEELIKKNGLTLPQVSFLYEFGEFWYPVPGMYGGFSVQKHEKGIQASSWCRVVGGSGQLHVIDKEGKVELVDEGFV